jgi:DNA-binding GntR family transcriptional regulator
MEMAARTATEADLGRLEAIIARQNAFAAIGDTDAFHGVEEGFHEAIAVISNHPGIW